MDNWSKSLLFHRFIPPAKFSLPGGQSISVGAKSSSARFEQSAVEEREVRSTNEELLAAKHQAR
jgi:hypothetical protein